MDMDILYISIKDKALNILMEQEESPTGTKTDSFQLNMILGSSSFYKTSEILQVTDH